MSETAATTGSIYEALHRRSDDVCRSVAFFGCLSTKPKQLAPDAHKKLEERYALIKSWQEITADLFARSLRGELPPHIAELFLSELPPHLRAYHQDLVASMSVLDTPMFFRTDEALLGKIIEVQCPGSMWGVYELLYDHYAAEGVKLAPESMSKKFSDALVKTLPGPPGVLHLLDNSSHPAGERYFLQRVRSHGAVRYYGYDAFLRPQQCNLIRGHSHQSVMSETFFNERRGVRAKNEMRFDLPPISIFDQKLQMCLPFWESTRAFYSDALRELFPYTTVVEPSGVTLETGERVTLEAFAALPAGKRQYFLKYAGADVSRNWGSRAVYRIANMSKNACKEQMERVTANPAEHWMLQSVSAQKEDIEYTKQDLTTTALEVYSRFSCFYGPTGLMGILGMHEPFYKVHGGDQTIISVVTSGGA